ncbi:hypothetical protein, partial [Pricia sp.]|uniref:hypothetical protein n=1 Tax=Pricia sp. TaxID=2268138 RepID=UPI0035931378
MTLIIGCITKDFGIIAGDTQLSSGDLKRGEFERLVQTKVHQYGPDFMMGILGKWGYIEPMKDCTGTQIDYFKTLNREIQKSAVKDKLGYLSKFLPGKPNIEATAIYIKKESNFILDCITNDGNEKTIKKITIADKRLVFNEPFFDTDPNYVESKVRDFIKINKLTDGLPDSL